MSHRDYYLAPLHNALSSDFFFHLLRNLHFIQRTGNIPNPYALCCIISELLMTGKKKKGQIFHDLEKAQYFILLFRIIREYLLPDGDH